MEIREWAIQILSSDTLEGKLWAPGRLTDLSPGPAIFWKEPTRPPGMGFQRHSRQEKLPSFHEHGDSDKRAICLHRFAGHELLAVEIMAYTLLAFPDAPKHFRKGVSHTLRDEQQHVQLYMARMTELGIQFGDLPLYRHFWKHTPSMTSPLHYVSIVNLTFEMANLDFAPHYGKSFAKNGDTKSAQLMATILSDEIAHVGFGWQWFRKLNYKDSSEWDTWEKILAPTLLNPKRAIGFSFNESSRRAAGISEEWISNLKSKKHHKH